MQMFKWQVAQSRGRTWSERSGFRTVLRRSFERALISRDDENLRFSNHGLSAPDNEAVSERAVGERHILERCADVPTASSTRDDTPKSADSCWHPSGQNNTGMPYTVEDRGNGQLAWPAVHQSDAVGLPVPEKTGSPPIGLQT